MVNMYEIIEALCKDKGIKPGKLCTDLGISRGIMSDLKAGRTKKLSAENISKVAAYFDVSTDYLLTGEKETAPAPEGEREISDDEIKLALFGGKGEVTDEMWEEAKFAVQLIKDRHKRKKGE